MRLIYIIATAIFFPAITSAQINELFLNQVTNIDEIFVTNVSSNKNDEQQKTTNINILPIQILKFFDAAVANDIQAVETLIESGVDVNSRNFAYRTAFMCTTDKTIETAKLLLKHGAYLNTRDNSGNTALMIASELGYKKFVEFLLSTHVIINTVNRDGCSALNLAVKNGFSEIVKLLIEHKAEINTQRPETIPMLITAVKQGYSTIVSYLLEYGLDPNPEIATTKTTALGIASASGNLTIVKELIKHGAEVNKKNIYGVTPLILAVSDKNYDVAEFLLKKGADVNVQTEKGLTLEHFIQKNDKKMADLLKKYKNQ